MKVFQIRQNFKSGPNPAQFWPEPDISRICKKGRISAGAGAELLYSPSQSEIFLTEHSDNECYLANTLLTV